MEADPFQLMATAEPAGKKGNAVRRSNSDEAFERALHSNSGSPRRRSSINLEDVFLILQENNVSNRIVSGRAR